MSDRPIEQKRELHDGAKELSEDKAFLEALKVARARTVDALTQAKTREEKDDLIAKLKCLLQIAAELTVLMNDYKQAAKRQAHARGPGPG
jgi:peptidoglycan hydrolase CwlO-like protein